MRLWSVHPRYLDPQGLVALWREALSRGYAFDASKVGPRRAVEPIAVTRGQIEYEWQRARVPPAGPPAGGPGGKLGAPCTMT